MFFIFKKVAMNNKATMKENSLVNLIIQLWAKHSYVIFKHKLLEFIKFAKITCVQVLKFMKDEHCFIVVAFIKNKLKYCFTCYLDMCTWFYAQYFSMIENFPFKKVITLWKDTKVNYCVQCKLLKANGVWFLR
jgi:hypothetical protein